MASTRKELANAVLRLLEKSDNPTKLAESIASFLVAERRTKELHSLLRDLEEMRFKTGGHLEVTATAASPLTESAKQEIKKIFKADNVTIHEEINKEILGGVKVRALDKAADFSVQARLQRLRQGVKT